MHRRVQMVINATPQPQSHNSNLTARDPEFAATCGLMVVRADLVLRPV